MGIEQKVKEVIAEAIGCELKEVLNEATLESLGADELDMFEIAMQLEDELDITIEDDAIMHLDTIQGFIDLVTNLKGV